MVISKHHHPLAVTNKLTYKNAVLNSSRAMLNNVPASLSALTAAWGIPELVPVPGRARVGGTASCDC